MTRRVDQIQSSGIRKIMDKAAGMVNVINLSIGQPDFAVPKEVKRGMVSAISSDKTGYTPTAGIATLRKKILGKYQGQKFAESAIVVPGVSAAIFLAYSALLEEGDELIIFDPYFVMYPDLAKFLNIKPVVVQTNPDFSINFEKLVDAISDKTKAIIINSPNNPTGHIYSKDELEQLAKIVKDHDLWVISDEVYECFDYENKFTSFGEVYEKTLVLNGFSKNFAMTGLRLGYAVGPRKIIDDMIKLQQYTFVCAPSIAQYAAAKNFDLSSPETIKFFKKRRDFVFEELRNTFELTKPDGAFYFFIRLSKTVSGEDFAEICLKHNLLVVPGSSFTQSKNYFRISFAVSDNVLSEGVKILKQVAKEMGIKNPL